MLKDRFLLMLIIKLQTELIHEESYFRVYAGKNILHLILINYQYSLDTMRGDHLFLYSRETKYKMTFNLWLDTTKVDIY